MLSANTSLADTLHKNVTVRKKSKKKKEHFELLVAPPSVHFRNTSKHSGKSPKAISSLQAAFEPPFQQP